jgi:hypothetical protein
MGGMQISSRPFGIVRIVGVRRALRLGGGRAHFEISRSVGLAVRFFFFSFCFGE